MNFGGAEQLRQAGAQVRVEAVADRAHDSQLIFVELAPAPCPQDGAQLWFHGEADSVVHAVDVTVFGGQQVPALSISVVRQRIEDADLAQSIVGLSAVAFYLMEVVGEAWSRAAWASRVSPFHHFHGADIISGVTHPARDFTILTG